MCYIALPAISETKGTSEAPSPRVGTASATLDGKIYLFSGRGGVAMAPIEEHGAMWVLDRLPMKWTKLAPSDPSKPYPAARSYHSSTSDNEGTIFIHAGCPESGRLEDLWSFHPSTCTWTQLADAPAPARGGTSIAFHGGLLYRANGFDGKSELGGSLDIFDPVKNTWSTKAYIADGVSGPIARSVATVLPVFANEKALLVTLFGESDPSSFGHQGAGKMLGDVWAYDIASETWSEVDTTAAGTPGRPAPRGWFDADVLEKSAILISGGLGEENNRLDDAWILQF